MKYLRISFFLIIICATVLIYAGNTGKFLGRIEDTIGNPINNANVIIMKNGKGFLIDTTGEKGVFSILKIPPGKYEIMVSAEGYRPAIVEDVVFEIDLTTVQNVTLKIKEGLCTEFDIHKAKVCSNDRIKPIGSTMGLEELERIAKSNPDSLDTHLGNDKQRLPEKDFGSNYVRGNNVISTIDPRYVEDYYFFNDSFSLILYNPDTDTFVTRVEMAQINENFRLSTTMSLDRISPTDKVTVNTSTLSLFVTDRATMSPIYSGEAFLTIDGIKYGSEKTDKKGHSKFIRIPNGVYEVILEAEGYFTNKIIIPAQESGAWISGIELDERWD